MPTVMKMLKAIGITAVSLVVAYGNDISLYAQDIARKTSKDQNYFLITSSGIGPVKLGATLDEAKKALPLSQMERTSDGDGVALVALKLNNEEIMVLYAGEDDSDAPINYSKNIQVIQTFSPRCKTPQGIGPGSLVQNAEKAYGKIKEISISEIESREYIDFTNSPSWLSFRSNGAGIYSKDPRRTTKYDPKSKILSISVSK